MIETLHTFLLFRLPQDVFETAKFSKILLAINKGKGAQYKGKSLDEIDFSDNVDTDDSDEEDNTSNTLSLTNLNNKQIDMCETSAEFNKPGSSGNQKEIDKKLKQGKIEINFYLRLLYC